MPEKKKKKKDMPEKAKQQDQHFPGFLLLFLDQLSQFWLLVTNQCSTNACYDNSKSLKQNLIRVNLVNFPSHIGKCDQIHFYLVRPVVI